MKKSSASSSGETIFKCHMNTCNNFYRIVSTNELSYLSCYDIFYYPMLEEISIWSEKEENISAIHYGGNFFTIKQHMPMCFGSTEKDIYKTVNKLKKIVNFR